MSDGQPKIRMTQFSIETMRASIQTFTPSATDTIVFGDATDKGFAITASSDVSFGNYSFVGKAITVVDEIVFGDTGALVFPVVATDTILFAGVGRTNKIPVSATDTIAFSDLGNRAGSVLRTATDTIVFGDPGDGHNTTLVASAIDTIAFAANDLPGGEWIKSEANSVRFTDTAASESSTKNVAAVDSIAFTDSALSGNPAILPVFVLDSVLFGDGASIGTRIPVSAVDTVTFSSKDPASISAITSLVIGDVGGSFQGNQSDENEVRYSDLAYGTLILPNPELGMSVVLRSSVDPHFPFTYVNTPTGLVLIANGVDPMLRWRPDDKKLDTAGVLAPTTAGTITATSFVNTSAEGETIESPAYRFYVRFVDRYGNYSDLSPVSELSRGEAPFTYTNVPVPTEVKVTRRQILRNLAGGANVYYVEIDTDDIKSDTFTGTLTDGELFLNEAVALVANDGSPIANVFGYPPAHKSCLAYHLGRVFAAVDIEYRVGNAIVESDSDVVIGVGTNWVQSMVGRAFWVIGARDFYTISSVDEVEQTLTLTAVWEGATDQYAQYTIRPQPEERRLIYYTEAGLAEGWPAFYAFELAEDGDDITGLVSFNSFLYIVERRNTYKITFRNDPILDGNVFASTNRGCVNQRCIVVVGDACYMLDEQGIHKFSGQTSEPVSQVIQDFFQGESGGISINWNADQKLWHAAWDSAKQLIRWFVSFGSDPEPRHAICYEYVLQRWWIETYERPIASSTNGLMPNQRCFVGSTGRAVLVLSEGTLDGVDASPETRGLITDPYPVAFSANARGALAADLVGFPVAIASGRGRGQVRTVVGVNGATAELDLPWMVSPGADSVFQLGGFSWEWKSGWFRFAEDEAANPRDIEIVYKPFMTDANFNLNLFYNHSPIPRNFSYDSDNSGVATTKDSPDVVIDMNGYDGYMVLRFDGHKETNIRGDRFLSVSLQGSGAIEQSRIYSVQIKGVE